jgi:hypothetical protein
VIWKGSQHQFVEDAALIDAEIVLHLIVAPIREVFRREVNLLLLGATSSKDTSAYRVEAIASDKSDRIREDSSRDGVRWRDSDTWDSLVSQVEH